MSSKPRVPLKELLREAEETSTAFLIVEGRSDKSFYREWLSRARNGQDLAPVIIEAVDAIEVNDEWVDSENLPHGARSWVIAAAHEGASSPANLRCIADLDCGHRTESYEMDHLWWTDYPALESYIFNEAGLDTVNRVVLGDRLPDGHRLIASLSPILRELYTVRKFNESLPTPNLSKGFAKGNDPKSFDVKRTVPPDIASESDEYLRPNFADPRAHAYGHDIAEILMYLFAAEIKNHAKIAHKDALENNFRLCLLLSHNFDGSPLAGRLLAWLGKGET
ncbi:hypothetical protein [Microbacterium sp. NPDC077486]|uniref:hypothetical protein n=1 Tax=Microbacterium sp. NPDC077486 TaxID=3154766 RepID=UPI0034283914